MTSALMLFSMTIVTLSKASPAYGPFNEVPVESLGSGPVLPTNVLSIPFGVVANSDESKDNEGKTLAYNVREVVTTVRDRFADVVDNVKDTVTDFTNHKDVVTDVVVDVKDRVSYSVDDVTAGGSSPQISADALKNSASSNETSDDSSDEEHSVDGRDDGSNESKKTLNFTTGVVEVNSAELAEDNSNKTDSDSSDEDDDNDNNQQGDKDNSKVENTSHKAVVEDTKKMKSKDVKSDDTNTKVVGYKDGKSETLSVVQTTTEIYKRDTDTKKDDNKGEEAKKKEDDKDILSWLKTVTGGVKEEDDDDKVKGYLTQMSKVKGYLEAIESGVATTDAREKGTCPVYPVKVTQTRVTITMPSGCKIIIKLKGVAVDSVDNGSKAKKSKTKQSVAVSYSARN